MRRLPWCFKLLELGLRGAELVAHVLHLGHEILALSRYLVDKLLLRGVVDAGIEQLPFELLYPLSKIFANWRVLAACRAPICLVARVELREQGDGSAMQALRQ